MAVPAAHHMAVPVAHQMIVIGLDWRSKQYGLACPALSVLKTQMSGGREACWAEPHPILVLALRRDRAHLPHLCHMTASNLRTRTPPHTTDIFYQKQGISDRCFRTGIDCSNAQCPQQSHVSQFSCIMHELTI